MRAPGRGPDELKDTNQNVPVSLVVRLGEMPTDRFVSVSQTDVPKVVYKPIFHPKECLSHILHATFFACDSINQVGTPT